MQCRCSAESLRVCVCDVRVKVCIVKEKGKSSKCVCETTSCERVCKNAVLRSACRQSACTELVHRHRDRGYARMQCVRTYAPCPPCPDLEAYLLFAYNRLPHPIAYYTASV